MTLVIHHVENRELLLREIRRILKRDGTFVIMTISHGHIRRHVLRDFPGVTAIDLKRAPSVPVLKENIRKTGFRNIHHHVVKYEEKTATSEYLERVKNKYISTLTLLSEEEFQKGFRIFQERVRRKYGIHIRRTVDFMFVVGQK